METLEKINYEELLKENLLKHRLVYVEKHSGVITFLKAFDSQEELIKELRLMFKDNDVFSYYSANEYYIRDCNINYSDYLSDMESLDTDDENEIRNIYKNISSYDEINKDVDEEDYSSGIYFFGDLILPIEGKITKSLKCEFPYTDGESNGLIGTIEIITNLDIN